jgi:hypothetical protein
MGQDCNLAGNHTAQWGIPYAQRSFIMPLQEMYHAR